MVFVKGFVFLLHCALLAVKRSKAEEPASPNISRNGEFVDLNLPLPGGKCCLVKVCKIAFYFTVCAIPNRCMINWTRIMSLIWLSSLEFCL